MSESKLKSVMYRCESILPLEVDSLEAVLKKMNMLNLRYALAHCDDGVVWGRRLGDGQWAWSSGVVDASPPIRLSTLQQLRLFGVDAEVFLWRDGATLRGRVIVEGDGTQAECLSESYLLWGKAQDDSISESENGFLPLHEGGQGFCHAPPTEIARAGALTIRHYVGFDAQGCARIVASRLVADL